ncbi:MAG: helix-turn-helix domain-containing protein [Oceanospirillales bacterium]|nr:helix-turn-helix domain-containing protein [Oceanospirillales bacterium]
MDKDVAVDSGIPQSTLTPKGAEAYRNKWGLKQNSFTQVPSLLLEYRDRLQIKDQEMFLLLVLLNHWWHRDRLPFPSIKRLCKLTGKVERTVQRNLKSLIENDTPVRAGWSKEPGYISVTPRFIPRGSKKPVNGHSQLSNEYCFDKLIYALRSLEWEITQKVDEVKEESQTRAPVSAGKATTS